MSKLNFLVHLNAYSDAGSSNAPSLSNFKWTRDLTGIPASNPISEAFTLAPGESKTIFSGTRTLAQSIDTVYSLQLKPLSSSTYRLQYTSGTAPLFRTPRVIGSDATTPITTITNGPVITYSSPASVSGATATFTGQAAGMTTDVIFDADTQGAAGNDIVLVGDGVSTLVELSDAWNTANPSNQIVQDIGDFSQVLDAAAEIQLAGGVDQVVGLNMTDVQIGDKVKIGSVFNTLNQGEFKILAKSANSFTVENYTGVNEGPITLGSQFADQIRIFSAAGVQEGDTLVISEGFSSVTFGSYKITDVTDNYVEFYSTSVLPQETGISSALDIYSQTKNLVYLEANQKCTVELNGVQMASMEPFIINNSKQPGVFMLKATVYSFTVTNNSLDTASCFVATVE